MLHIPARDPVCAFLPTVPASLQPAHPPRPCHVPLATSPDGPPPPLCAQVLDAATGVTHARPSPISVYQGDMPDVTTW